MSSYEFGFREVIPDQTLPEKWRELTLNTGGTQSTLQDIKVPERAGGYCYTDITNPYCRNRFIYWRICHDILELVEHSLDIDLLGNHVRFRFQDTPILEGVSIQEMYSNVVVLVPTVSSVHRLVFPHPEKIYQKQKMSGHHPQPSIFAEASLQSNNQQYIINHTAANSPLPHTAATYIGMNEDAVFALSYSTGVTLLVKMDYISGMITTTELKQTSIMDRIWPGRVVTQLLRGKPSEEEVPCSMVLHTLGLATYLFTLGQDCKLRMWSSERAECIMVVDILETTTENRAELVQGHQSHLLRKATGRDDNDLYLGAYLSFADKSIFIVVRPIMEQGLYNVERIYTTYDNQGDLVDFWMSSTRLWTIWSTAAGDTVIRHKTMDRLIAPGRINWLEVYQEVPPARSFDPSQQGNVDPRQAYQSYIFHPGQFPLSVINRALTIYRRPASGVTPTLLPDVSAAVLRERVAMAVEAEISSEVQQHELSDDEYLDVAWRCWARFYSCCIQYYWAGTRPIAFLAGRSCTTSPGPLPGCPLGLVRKAQFSLFRPVDELEHLFVIGTDSCGGATQNLPPVLTDTPLLDDNMVCLMKALLVLEKKLSQEVCDTFTQDIHRLESPDNITDAILKDLVLDPEMFTYTFLRTVFVHIQEEVMTEAALKLLQVLALDDNPGLEMDLDADDIPHNERLSISYMFSSQLGANVVAESLHQACTIRFNMLRNLLILCKLIMSQFHMVFPVKDSNRQTSEMIRSMLIPRTTVLLQGYYVINWIALVPCTQVAPSMIEASMQQLSVLCMTDGTEVGDSVRLNFHNHRTLTLLSLFLTSKSVRYAHNLMAQRRLDEETLSQWHTALLPYAYTIGKLIWPLSSLFVFPEFLVTSCQYLLIQEYVRLLSRWCDCNVFSRLFLLGSVLLDMGESEKACDHMLRSVEGVHSEEFLMSHLGQPRMDQPEPSDQHRKVLFYLKVIKMFEQMDHSDCVLRIADEAVIVAEKDDPDLATLHSIRFSHLLRIGRHTKAYDSMVRNPDVSRRRDSLRQLLNSMVEAGELNQLVCFGYEGMLEDVQDILLAKARSQDLLSSHFYTILHALHISKCNYRKSATVLYEQAFRLGQEVVGIQSLERQARCLLGCINELHLVSEAYRWVLKPVLAAPTMASYMSEKPSASPKRNYDGEEVVQSRPKRKVEIVEVTTMKKEYEVVLAKLKLLGPDASNSAVSGVAHLTVRQLLGVLTGAGKFDLALRLASLFGESKTSVVESMTGKCVQVTREEGFGNVNADWLKTNSTADLRRSDHSVASVAWKYLQRVLVHHEEKGHTALHRAVVLRLIQLEAFLPQWLIDSYKKRQIAELLRLLIGAGRLEEAAQLCCDLYRAGMGEGSEEFNMGGLQARPASVCMPHNVLEWCLEELKTAVQDREGEQYEMLLDEMTSLRSQYLEAAQRLSNELITGISRQPAA